MQSDKYCAGLEKRFGLICEMPEAFTPVPHIKDGFRRSVYGSHSIYYRIGGGEIEIMRIIGKQEFIVE
ncbi:MAG: plasmid stabilization system [Hyphomonadaceae bacterium]|nr:MAG: plasmid stabilization system [Hyphomonadaceae bacterium]KAF0185058.1 MAG: plasmid stabilization system [Hyphomonadaceae bacterium]